MMLNLAMVSTLNLYDGYRCIKSTFFFFLFFIELYTKSRVEDKIAITLFGYYRALNDLKWKSIKQNDYE